VAQPAKRSSTTVTYAVLVAAFIAYSLLQSLVSPVLPEIQHDLHTNQSTVTWVLTVYLLSAAVFTPILGRVGDIIGKEKMFVVALGALSVGSVIAALAPNIEVLIFARAVQGIGGAMFPLGFGIVRDEFPRERVAGVVGVLAAVMGVGGGFGIVLAGPIVEAFNYHWLFWFPLMIVGPCTIAAFFFVPPSPVRTPSRVNWLGAVLLSAWLITLLVGVSEAPEWGWFSTKVLGLLVAAIIFFIVWIYAELHTAHPVIDMKLMRQPIIWRTNAVTALFGVSMFAVWAFLPQFVQTPRAIGYGFGSSITEAGLILLPASIMMLVVGPVSAALGRRFSQRDVLAVGAALTVVSFGLIALPVHQLIVLYISTTIMGAGIGLAFATLSSIVVAAVPATQTGVANGMNTNIRTIGGAVGAAVLSSIITARMRPNGYPDESGYTHGWIVMAVLAAISVGVALTIPRVLHRPETESLPAPAETVTIASVRVISPAPAPASASASASALSEGV
jgi:EmrB/QacA subfamily drug resistance transporter